MAGTEKPVAAALAPSGRLRAGINYGNVILAGKDPASGELSGVHVDLARELGRRIGVPVELVGRPAAGELVAALTSGELDIALLSAEPAREKDVVFSPVYLEVGATYLVPLGSPLRTAADADREGARIAIAAGSVYAFYLERTLKRARLVNAPSTHAAYELFAAQKLDALVGLRPRLVADAAMMPGSRILDGRFMVVGQSIAMAHGRGAGVEYLRRFVGEVTGSGLVGEWLARHDVRGVRVAGSA